MSDLISKKELYRKLGEAYNHCLITWGENEIIKDIIGECDPVENKGDLISRQAVENITWEEPSYTDPLNVLTEVREKVRALPSVENKGEDRPKGHWIYPSYPNNYPYMWKSICSNCNTGFPTINKDYKYCPNCGADMRGETDGK